MSVRMKSSMMCKMVKGMMIKNAKFQLQRIGIADKKIINK